MEEEEKSTHSGVESRAKSSREGGEVKEERDKEEERREAATAESAVSILEPSSVTEEEVGHFCCVCFHLHALHSVERRTR